ncbi:carbon-nitrogen hydrolase [Cristinia sonorae]|uniref:Carbon-nitrogen hydrolase n=1 Tax=Cristinia sonorae TaxID=1940300 RepID=A0A8K0XRQ6_9AGAR|nr:carbon-nitrogen hydrolase [Cristinia sonorae]
MANIIVASVVQACTVAYSLPETLDKLENYARLAKERDGSQLVVFPEAFIGGYPKMSTFGVTVGNRKPEGRDEFVRYHSAAIDIPSPAITRLESISRELHVFLVVGVIERDGGTLYCTVVFVDPVQGYLCKHRKLLPTGLERVIWGQGDATTLPVPEVSFVAEGKGSVKAKVSSTICWENYMPLLRTFYYSQGTQIYCAPTVDARPEWQHTMKHIALEGRCFVLSACQYAEEKDYPSDHAVADEDKRDPKNIMIAGGSVIVSPLGQVLAGPLLGEEGVLTARLDLDDVVRGKFDLDVTGHYARPDSKLFSSFIGRCLTAASQFSSCPSPDCSEHGKSHCVRIRSDRNIMIKLKKVRFGV